MSILGAPRVLLGAPSRFQSDRIRYKLPRFCEQNHIEEIHRVAQELRDEGHTIEETDDPKSLCRDISNALKTPSGTSFPLTKTLVTALLLFGFASPAEALQSGKQVCAPTVCMLNGGKDLTRSTYMKEYVAPNHPDKGGDVQSSQFFNDCGRELFQSSNKLSCEHVKYDKNTEKAVTKFIESVPKRDETLKNKEKEHEAIIGKLEFIKDPEVIRTFNEVKRILQEYGWVSRAITSIGMDITNVDANVLVANMKSFVSRDLRYVTEELDIDHRSLLDLKGNLAGYRVIVEFANKYLKASKSQKLKLITEMFDDAKMISLMRKELDAAEEYRISVKPVTLRVVESIKKDKLNPTSTAHYTANLLQDYFEMKLRPYNDDERDTKEILYSYESIQSHLQRNIQYVEKWISIRSDEASKKTSLLKRVESYENKFGPIVSSTVSDFWTMGKIQEFMALLVGFITIAGFFAHMPKKK